MTENLTTPGEIRALFSMWSVKIIGIEGKETKGFELHTSIVIISLIDPEMDGDC